MMYKLRCCIFSLFWLFTLLLQGQVAWAETDLLNLSAYQEASTPLYGENVLVGQDEKTGVKWLTVGKEAGSTGRLKFPVNLSGDFEISFKTYAKLWSGYQDFFITADEYRIKLSFGGDGFGCGVRPLQAGSEASSGDESNSWVCDTTNTLRLSVVGNVAKLYVNDVFSQKLTLKSSLTYTQVLYDGLANQDSRLYELKLGGSGGSAQPPVTGSQEPETDLLNLSTYQEATTPSYGENVQVAQDEKTELKWLTVGKEAGSSGRLKLPVNLSGDFEVLIKTYAKLWSGYQDFVITADEYKIKLSFGGDGRGCGVRQLQAGSETSSGDKSDAWICDTTNTLRLSVIGNIAKLYVNNVFSQKLTLKPDLTYTLLLYNGLANQDSRVYKLKVGKTVTVNPTLTPDLHVKFCSCPPIGPAHATDANGKPVNTKTVMEGGNSVNGQSPVSQVTQKVTDTVDIKGNIVVDPVDVGQPVEAFVYVAVTFPWSGNLVYYYMLGPGGAILLWDQNPANLAAFMTFSQLAAKQEIPMYSGVLPLLSTLDVFFGYRLPNGTVISNSQPINILMIQ